MSQPVTGRTRDVVVWLDKLIYILAKHWLFAVNWAVLLYVALPLLAPVLMHQGYDRLGTYLYDLYGPPTCHQLPERSYFFYGPSYTYSLAELEALTGAEVPLRYIGNAEIGYKAGLCQRCVAIYLTLFIAGLAFALVRPGMRPLHWKQALWCLAPLAVDGVGQLVGLWESTWLTRTITGVSASVGVVGFLYPHLDRGFEDVKRTVERQLRLDLAGGSAGGAARGEKEQGQGHAAQDQQRPQLVDPVGQEQRHGAKRGGEEAIDRHDLPLG